ncbi:putative origin recognition complex, subunit 5, P-loop containing nucleoside triphosphate hydrolase [Helianthus annuus]|uniref:Origin recognition complex, subunit 5, P-loop containing nucleoside triphosphate hydrolase n=1 Tax=Helianthus annuus TaxID=4232 RepID=A0A251V162_HELAN|nr:origin of replication complex subunit 5 [Helianthus annuus]KAF5811606.1 putative origin recognition complex, subunit 5, P-loop containing nucleoside triphosphate hydrolase [Helianthus annuus]KAJ0928352.1 putative origin recognition complex, subunit 5, P-loop containing nucleoside triphosphate hydrolase [Helianthus annuus]KAJ0932711.1 putative origin recognition complex, subunit 5, P-loop containing nucleoside triphosphate hydrolase [Helianthus annuus]
MSKEETPQVTRRTTRLSATHTPNAIQSPTKSINLPPLSLHNLVYGEQQEPLTFDDLISSLPGRKNQIFDLLRLLGPVNSPMSPMFVYGSASTGKTSTILRVFRYLNRPFVYSSCRTCYNARQLFDNILNQLLLHRKSENNGYSSAKKCEKPADFVNLLKEALVGVVDGLKRSSSSKKLNGCVNGSMVYLIFDSLELVRDWDKSGTILPLLFKLHDVLKVNDVGLIFISSSSLDTYHSETGFVDPISVYFPDYTEEGLRQIFMRNQANPKLRSAFLDVVLKPFCRVTRRLDELSTALSPLFKKYCEPLDDLNVIPDEETKRKLFSCLQPHIGPALNEILGVTSQSSVEAGIKNNLKRKGGLKKFGNDSIDDIDFHMSTSAKYLLVSAFLASRNPATLDASFFDSTGGSANQKKRRKTSEKSKDLKEASEQELFMKGPGTFPLERLLAIFQCIASSDEYSLENDEDPQETTGLGGDFGENNLMSDILLQVSSLCNANFITKGGSCPLEGSTRYRSTISEDLALKVARSLKFPLSKYLYRR